MSQVLKCGDTRRTEVITRRDDYTQWINLEYVACQLWVELVRSITEWGLNGSGYLEVATIRYCLIRVEKLVVRCSERGRPSEVSLEDLTLRPPHRIFEAWKRRLDVSPLRYLGRYLEGRHHIRIDTQFVDVWLSAAYDNRPTLAGMCPRPAQLHVYFSRANTAWQTATSAWSSSFGMQCELEVEDSRSVGLNLGILACKSYANARSGSVGQQQSWAACA